MKIITGFLLRVLKAFCESDIYSNFNKTINCLEKSSFLHFYQVVSAIPSHLLNKARAPENLHSENIDDDGTCFQLDGSVAINLMKAKASDFYWLLINRLYKKDQTGPSRWNKAIPMEKTEWSKIFKSTYRTCKEPKLKEFSFKFTHRIIVTKKELFRFKIKPDGNCVYCGEPDSIDHTFLACRCIQSFVEKVLKWFNLDNGTVFSLNSQKIVFGLLNECGPSVAKLDYTLLFLRYYIYQKKLQEDSLVLQHFVSQIKYKYSLEKL